MKKKLVIGSVVALLAVIAIPIAAFAGKGHGGGHGFCHKGGAGVFGKMHQIKSEIDLTDAQEEKIHAIMKEGRKSNEPQLESIHENLMKAARVLVDNPAATAQARQVLAAQSATEQQLKSNILDGVARAAQVLTPEQRQKLSALLD